MITRDLADNSSSPETVLDVITKATTGSEAASTMSSMSLGTGCQPLRLRQRSSNIVCSPLTPSLLTPPADNTADSVAEAAVVGINDELTGQAVNAFVALKEGTESSDQVKKELIQQVRKSIGPFAAPQGHFCGPRPAQDKVRQDHASHHAEDLGGGGRPAGRHLNGKCYSPIFRVVLVAGQGCW
jgi:acyl-CoA synthetase (AMP-forming)/AMP-acid ligase II